MALSHNWMMSQGNTGDAGDTGDNHGEGSGSGGTRVVTREKAETKEPSFYKVILLNDDFTPMDFVVHILTRFFKHGETEAQRIMLQVHQQGSAVAGTYPFELAETKVFLVNDYARKNKHPLKCSMEKA